MAGLQLEVAAVGRGGQGKVHGLVSGLSGNKLGEELPDARKGLGLREEFLLKGGLLRGVFFGRDGELGPLVEDTAGLEWTVRGMNIGDGKEGRAYGMNCSGELGRWERECTYIWLRTTLQLSLDRPRQQRLSIFLKNGIGDIRVFVLGVDEQAIHVEETCPHAG